MISSRHLSFSRKFRIASVLSIAAAAILMPAYVQSEVPGAPSGDAVLQQVRLSQAMQELPELTGRLRNDLPDDGKREPFRLTMANSVIQFTFSNPDEVILLDLGQGGTKLSRTLAGKSVSVAEKDYGNLIRGTAVNYEDLSMRFLYWPNAQVMDQDNVSSVGCWVVRAVNPDNRGPYHVVDIWAAKESGAILKIDAYDRQAKRIKSFRVSKGQKYKGAWILKQMTVEGRDPATGKVIARTYMDINDPK